MNDISIDSAMLRSLLDAAAMTALNHRGNERELYVLGQLETTANIAYILCAGKVDYELEGYCQKLAAEAIERMEYLSPKEASSSSFSNQQA
ncbi:MAG: hypothetical protein MI867_09545 [Pseudomonadales bacterium]|nr:hypothetical protein [Pseudomonadales bacterium]